MTAQLKKKMIQKVSRMNKDAALLKSLARHIIRESPTREENKVKIKTLAGKILVTTVAAAMMATMTPILSEADDAELESKAEAAEDADVTQNSDDMNAVEAESQEYSEEGILRLTIEDGELKGSMDADKVKKSKLKEKYGVRLKKGELSISSAGTYILSGELEGSVSIDTADEGEVTLILDEFTVFNAEGPALTAKKTEKLTIVLKEGTKNYIKSGTVVIVEEAEEEEETSEADEEAAADEDAEKAEDAETAEDAADNEETDSEKAAEDTETEDAEADDADNEETETAVSHTRLEYAEAAYTALEEANTEAEAFIKEAETKAKEAAEAAALTDEEKELYVTSVSEAAREEAYKDFDDTSAGSLYSKVDTVIKGSGILIITGFLNNGIHVTKTLTMESGYVYITTANNAVKVKDTFAMTGGSLNIVTAGDGINASREAVEEETEAGIVTTEAAGSIIIDGGYITIESDGDAMQALLDITVNGGTINATAHGRVKATKTQARAYARSSMISAKGLKSEGSLTINDGSLTLATYDDCIHSSGLLTINGGTMSVRTYDDGVHSDQEIDINGGILNIGYSYEGIEANQIIINDGTISLYATDDGMNANGGSGSFGGQSNKTVQRTTPNITFNGGDIYVNAYGDGIDSNGNITVNGGKLIVDGPTDSWNGPLDGGTENGGKILINGGVVFAGGASGMAEGFGSASTQYSILATLKGYTQGAEIKIYDPQGNEIFSHTVASGGTSIVFSSPELKADETYTMMINEDKYEFSITSISSRATLKKIETEEETETVQE